MVIKRILDAMNPRYKMLKINIYEDGEIWFYLYEKEYPIMVDINKKSVVLAIETGCVEDFYLDNEILRELAGFIDIIKDCLDEIELWVK